MTNRYLNTLIALVLPAFVANATEPYAIHRAAPMADTPASEVITDATGEPTYYTRVSYGWYVYAGANNIMAGEIPGTSKLIRSVDDPTVAYLYNPLTADARDTYILCHIDGNKLTAQFPQTLAVLDDVTGVLPLYIGKMQKHEDENGVTYMPVDEGEDNTFTWTIHDDGKLTLDHEWVDIDENGKFRDEFPTDILGTYYYMDGPDGNHEAYWNGVGDWYQTYTPVVVEPITPMPTGIKVEAWQMKAKKVTRMVDVAIDGDHIYIANLTPYGDGALVGTISDGKAVFPTLQNLGFSFKTNANVYFVATTAFYDTYDFGDYQMSFLDHFEWKNAMTLDYDASAKTLRFTEPNECILINAFTDRVGLYEYIEEPNFAYLPPEGMNARPRNPVINVPGRYEGFDDGYYLEFDLPTDNVNGVTLNTDRLYYNIYLNDELFTFWPDQYQYLEQEVTDIPYSLSDRNHDFTVTGLTHMLQLHSEGIHTIGVQSCFVGFDDVVYRSDIVTCQTETYTEDWRHMMTHAAKSAARKAVLAAESAVYQTIYNYADKDSKADASGTGMHETYDMAIALTNPSLAGMTISAIEIPVYPSTYISDLKVWISDKLTIELVDGKNVNVTDRSWDIEYPQTGAMQYIRFDLDEPYTIPADGTYVGYSFTVNELHNLRAETYVPMQCGFTAKPGGLYLHTSRSFLDWQDRSELVNSVAMTQVYLTGEFLNDAVSFGNVEFQYLAVNAEQTVAVPLFNIGVNDINSVTYTVSSNAGETLTGTIDFETPMPTGFAYSQSVDLPLPELQELGLRTFTVEIAQVNGKANENADNTMTFDAKVLNFVPKHLGVIEEYTGTWCGWCPRGYVAMELMREMHPDFLGIAYHYGDPMEMAGGYPLLTNGAPSVTVNRMMECDPFYAKGVNSGFRMPEVWSESCAGFVPVGINLNAQYNADGTVTVNSDTEWADDAADGDYAIEYVLIADDVYDIAGTGNPLTWMQHNYYSTEPVEEYLEWVCSQPSYIYGLHFNDVAILTSGLHGVDGSVTSTEVGYSNRHQYVFDTHKAMTPASAGGIAIPFHPGKLRVAALLLDRAETEGLGQYYGKVVNATVCNVAYDPDGINDVNADHGQIVDEYYHDVQGRRIDTPTTGIYMRTRIYSDGHVTNTKVRR